MGLPGLLQTPTKLLKIALYVFIHKYIKHQAGVKFNLKAEKRGPMTISPTTSIKKKKRETDLQGIKQGMDL